MNIPDIVNANIRKIDPLLLNLGPKHVNYDTLSDIKKAKSDNRRVPHNDIL